MNKRTLVMLRNSTARQDPDFTADIEQIKEWLEDNDVVVAEADWRREHATSGTLRKRDRPELERVLAECDRGEIERIVWADWDRAGRSGARTMAMIEDLAEDLEVECVFVRDQIVLPAGEPIPEHHFYALAGKMIGGKAKIYSTSRATKGAFEKIDGVTYSRKRRDGTGGNKCGRKEIVLTDVQWKAIDRLMGERMPITQIAAYNFIGKVSVDGVEQDITVKYEAMKKMIARRKKHALLQTSAVSA